MIFSSRFLKKYDYYQLISNDKAISAYVPVWVSYIVLLVAISAFMICATRIIYAFIYQNTGVSPTDERYGRTEKEYHKTLKKRWNILLTGFILLYVAKLTEALLNLGIKLTYVKVDKVASAIPTPMLPWFNIVVIILEIFVIGYTFYYANLLKEEVKLKFSMES